MRTLVVTAVVAERDAVLAALPAGGEVEVIIGGVGPVAAAVSTARALADERFGRVLSAGICGGFAPLTPGDVVVGARSVLADLGAQTADGGFAPMAGMALAVDTYDVEPQLAIELADRTGGRLGTILTVSTVTGTAARAGELQGRFPDALAEAMEGAGVAAAADAAGVGFGEIRAVSNVVGPRDRDAWELLTALDALGPAVAAAVAAVLPS